MLPYSRYFKVGFRTNFMILGFRIWAVGVGVRYDLRLFRGFPGCHVGPDFFFSFFRGAEGQWNTRAWSFPICYCDPIRPKTLNPFLFGLASKVSGFMNIWRLTL